MTRRVRGALIAGTILLAGVLGLAVARRAPYDREPPVALRVVTSTPVLYSLTAQVLGDVGTLANLVPPGASPEQYALRLQDAEALAHADVIVVNGLQFEVFLESALAQAERRGTRVITASESILTIGHPPDPHIWVDPLRAGLMVGNIARGLAAVAPAQAGVFSANAAAAQARLAQLDGDIRQTLTGVASRRFLAFHPAWGYFAARYDLEQVAVIEEIPGRSPTAGELKEMARVVRAAGVRALFSEPQFSPRLAQALARDLGLQVFEVNPEGGKLSFEGYEQLMRENAGTFAKALAL